MPGFSAESLVASIDSQLGAGARSFCIALSGGLDSAALLHAMAAARALRPNWAVRAVHVDHGLQPASGGWAERCAAWAEAVDVPCTVRRVRVVDVRKQGVEAAAREARYGVLGDCLEKNEVLLTAHHADDQLETLLIALLRGAGVAGLASMPVCTPFAQGWRLRPLLGFTRQELSIWARERNIAWLEDPTNGDSRFDRNFLRHEIIPRLRERWPSVAATVSRTARHMAEADTLLDEFTDRDLQTAARGDCLAITALRELTPPRRRLTLRRWLQQRGLLLPSTSVLAALEHDMLAAADDRVPCIRWRGAEVHRYRGLLYAAPATEALRIHRYEWDWRQTLSLEGTLGELRMAPASQGLAVERLPRTLTVSFRQGGEAIQLAGETHRRKLKKLLQASDVLPWLRTRVPLVYAGEQLVAVADLWVDSSFAAKENEQTMRVEWKRLV